MSGVALRTRTIGNTLQVAPQVAKVRFWPSAVAVSGSAQMLQVQCGYRPILVAYMLYDARWGDGQKWARAHLCQARKEFPPFIARWQEHWTT